MMPNVIYNRQREGGVRRLVADIRLARDLLNFRPQVSLAEGLTMTLTHDSRLRQAAVLV
jgi:nucleoside-diphosphate-sugar epimerase